MIGNQIAGFFSVAAPPVPASNYESITTVTVGSGGSSSITFSSIPSTYKHLQIRGISRSTASSGDVGMQVNGSTNITRRHLLYGTGSSSVSTSDTFNSFYIQPVSSDTASVFAGFVTDILDANSTTKFKTIRTFNGYDTNGGGLILLISTLLQTTSAISSITITPASANLAEYSSFALYGITGA